jgi:hypothetical protein
MATEADATFLTVAARRSLDRRGIGAATYKDLCVLSSLIDFSRCMSLMYYSKVLLSQLESGVLVAIFKERKALEGVDGTS